jgi:potassium efflux system protein
VLQVVAGLTLLLAAEPLLGNWLRYRVGQAQLAQLTRSFDLLWWIIPAFFVNLAVDRFVWKPAEQSSGRPVPTLLRWSVASVIFLLATFGVIAFVYSYTLTGLLATSGVVAMIIGLAVQLNITNLFAGVALNLERPFRVGDWIMVHGRTPRPEDGVVGQVVDINWRTTRLQTADETVIVIPNGQLSEKTITNFMGPHEISRFQLVFTVDQAVSSDRVLAVIREALDEVTGAENGPTDQDPPKVRIKQVTETGVEYLVHYYLIPRLVSPNKGRHSVNEAILRHLRGAGIELAYPKRRVYEQQVPADPHD